MSGRLAAAAAATAGLALAPLAGNARVLLLPTCTGGVHMLVLPGDPTADLAPDFFVPDSSVPPVSLARLRKA